MRARFFYGYGREITFKDRLQNGENPVSEAEQSTIEDFLGKIKARMGFYQIDGSDVSSLVLLEDCTRKDAGFYEEWCPHCGGCTLYDMEGDYNIEGDTVLGDDDTLICIWCGEELFPCSACRECGNSDGHCNFNAKPHSCKVYQGQNKLPDFIMED